MTDEISVQFGEWMRKARRSRGFTQAQVTRALGWHQTQVSRIENGQQSVSLFNALRISRLLHEPLPDFQTGLTELCLTCAGNPPKGFACRACGSES